VLVGYPFVLGPSSSRMVPLSPPHSSSPLFCQPGRSLPLKSNPQAEEVVLKGRITMQTSKPAIITETLCTMASTRKNTPALKRKRASTPYHRGEERKKEFALVLARRRPNREELQVPRP